MFTSGFRPWLRNRELKQETSLSKRTSNSRWKTGSTPACVAWLNCVKHVKQCYITTTLLVLILFSLFLQISWIITFSKRQEICFSNDTFKDCSHLTGILFCWKKTRLEIQNLITIVLRQRLHERAFTLTRFHAFETAAKSIRFGSVSTESVSPENRSCDGISTKC